METRNRLSTVAICLFLVLSALWVYHPIRHHAPTNCDDFYLTQNTFIMEQSGWNLKTLVYGATQVPTGVWMPITGLLVVFEHFLFGTDFGLYRMGNLLLHMANGILLFFALRRMTGGLWKSGLVAALFVLHPLNVEPVAWLVGIRVVLCAFFGLAAIYWYASAVRRPATWKYVFSLFAVSLSITSVAMYVTLPFVLLLIDYWPLEREPLFITHPDTGGSGFNWPGAGRLLWEKMPFFVLILGMSAIVLAAHDLPFVHHHPLAHRILNVPLAYVQYLAKFFFPTGLSVFYPLPAEFPAWKVAGAVFLLLAVTVGALRTAKTHRFFIVGWLWFAGMMVPLSGIAQIGTQAMADHYMYLPMIGLLIAVVWGADAIMGNWKHKAAASWTAAVVVLALFTGLSARQVGVWKNSFTLLNHALAVTKNNYEAHNHLGQAFAEEGDNQNAIDHFIQALAIRPDHAKSHHNLANVYVRTGNLEKAESHYRQALVADPENAATFNSLGLVQAALGRLPDAIASYQKALEIMPDYVYAHSNIAAALMAAGRLEEAAAHCQKALTIHPGMIKARLQLAEIRTAMGMPAKAARHYEVLVKQAPTSADLHYLAGRAFYESGQTEKARSHLEQALAVNPQMGTARRLLRQIKPPDNGHGPAPRKDPNP